MEIKWVDTHCHLQLLNKNLDENHFKNIEFLVIPGVDVESSSKAKEISSSLEVESYWSAGLHPHDAKLLDTQRHDLEKLFVEADLIGETGLDFYRNLSTKEEQRENFLFHLEFSKQLNKPIIIHCRDSFQDTYDLLVEFNNPSSVILHSWTGGRKWTKRFRELDVYFSMSGIVTYETAKDLQISVKEIPMNRLLLETDTPYLTPVPLKGKDNRPNFISHTASKISNLLFLSSKIFFSISLLSGESLKSLMSIDVKSKLDIIVAKSNSFEISISI